MAKFPEEPRLKKATRKPYKAHDYYTYTYTPPPHPSFEKPKTWKKGASCCICMRDLTSGTTPETGIDSNLLGFRD